MMGVIAAIMTVSHTTCKDKIRPWLLWASGNPLRLDSAFATASAQQRLGFRVQSFWEGSFCCSFTFQGLGNFLTPAKTAGHFKSMGATQDLRVLLWGRGSRQHIFWGMLEGRPFAFLSNAVTCCLCVTLTTGDAQARQA